MNNPIVEAASNSQNVLARLEHGMGIFNDTFRELSKDYKVKLVDLSRNEFTDILQVVPTPNGLVGTDLAPGFDDVEVVIFDELQRCKKYQTDVILQLLKNKTFDGHRLPNLKSIVMLYTSDDEAKQIWLTQKFGERADTVLHVESL